METASKTARLKPLTGRGRPVRIGEDPVTIGRHPDNAIRLKDEKASRFHCVIEASGPGKLTIRDLGSRNGTKVNKKRIEARRLSEGDVVKVGSHEFVVEFKDPAADTSGTPWSADLIRTLEAAGEVTLDRVKLRMIDASGNDSDALSGGASGAVAARLLLLIASETNATDIHIEPKRDCTSVRMRVDGQLIWIIDLPSEVGTVLSGLIKTATQAKDLAKDAVVDGHFSIKFRAEAEISRRVEYRASFTPSVHGAKLVIRVLDMKNVPRSLEELGLPTYMLDRVRRCCELDAGMILCCGPTGSGKTTTLYNALREVDRETRNVITIEDPVEYQIDGVTQMPIDSAKGHTFASLLRSVLRQDPDVILVGEIRDPDTARVAMQAAMTGHVVFSTVHAKDTISSVFRLMDLDVEPYLVANSLQLVLAQRLVRMLCPRCKRAVDVSPGEATRMGRYLGGAKKLYVATGCRSCLKTGYQGRGAIYELLDVNDDLRDVILSNPTIHGIKQIIEQGLFTTLEQSGWKLAATGATPLSEVERVTGGH
ncbi:MAG: ATPase, T2SS/T4P/T4SS family [Planctomycetota bacterium]